MKRTTISFNDSKNIKTAVEYIIADIKKESEGRKPILILFTANSDDFVTASEMLSTEFADCTVMGQSSYVNFSSKGYTLGGCSAMTIFDNIECAANVILDVKKYPLKHADCIKEALSNIHSTNDTICLEFTTAFGNCEELVQDTLRTVLEPLGIPAVGGSSGAVENSKVSYVSLNGKVYTEACVFAIIRNLNGSIRIFKENLFKPTEYYFTATDVDCDERAVYEYDGKPASLAVANALHVPVENLKDRTKMHPVGRVENDRIYITEVDNVFPDGRITYFSRIYNHTQVVQLEVDDMDMVWDLTAGSVHKEMKDISFSIVVNCLARSVYFLSADRFEDFDTLLTEEYGDFIGVSGYGEQMDFQHLNQTMLLVCFE